MTDPDKSRQSLTVVQENVIDLLVQGRSDREAAEVVGVARSTVTEWRNQNACFLAVLNQRRQETWGVQLERLRNLVAKAVGILAEDLNSQDARLRQAAAIHVLRAVGLYDTDLRPTGSTTVEAVENDWLLRELLRSLCPRSSSQSDKTG